MVFFTQNFFPLGLGGSVISSNLKKMECNYPFILWVMLTGALKTMVNNQF